MPIPFFFTPFVPAREQEPINVLTPVYLFWDGVATLNGSPAASPQVVTELGAHVLDVTRAAANERDVITFVVVDPNTLRVNLEAVETEDADNVRFIKIKPLLGDGKIYDVGRNAFPVTQAKTRARLVTNAAVFQRLQMRRLDGSWENVGAALARKAAVMVAGNLDVPRGKRQLRVVVELTSGPIISGTGIVFAFSLADVAEVTDTLLVQLN